MHPLFHVAFTVNLIFALGLGVAVVAEILKIYLQIQRIDKLVKKVISRRKSVQRHQAGDVQSQAIPYDDTLYCNTQVLFKSQKSHGKLEEDEIEIIVNDTGKGNHSMEARVTVQAPDSKCHSVLINEHFVTSVSRNGVGTTSNQSCEYVDVQTMQSAYIATGHNARTSDNEEPQESKLKDFKSEHNKMFFTNLPSGEFNTLSTETDTKNDELQDNISTCEEPQYANIETVILTHLIPLTDVFDNPKLGSKEESTKPQTDNLYEQLRFDTENVVTVNYDTMCFKSDVETLNDDNSLLDKQDNFE